MTERDYLIALSSFNFFGPLKVKLLLEHFGSAQKAFLAPETSLSETGINEETLNRFLRYRNSFDFDRFYKTVNECGANIVTLMDKSYPLALKEITDPPTTLFVRGEINNLNENAIAIVGSRMMTDYGKSVARKFAQGLSDRGISIISGLAFGVDLEVHKSVLDVGGKCIAVLASGIDLITPRSNEWLGRKILENGGSIISEYAPGVIPEKYYFPYRNRIISGLSKGVLIVEGMIKSGTIHTARHAVEQGKPVFAIPGDITSPLSAAPLYLLKSGAILVTEVDDILMELGML